MEKIRCIYAVLANKIIRYSFLCNCHCLYKSFWKGFESDQRWLLNNIAGYQKRLLVWRVVNKQDAQISSHVSNIVMLTSNSRSPWEMISSFKATFAYKFKQMHRFMHSYEDLLSTHFNIILPTGTVL